MALAFADNTTQRVDFGSNAALDNIAAGGIVLIFRPNSLSEVFRYVTSKRTTGPNAGPVLYRPAAGGSSGAIRFDLPRATATLSIYANPGTFTTAWQFLGLRWNINGVDADQQMFRGVYPQGAFSEVSYATQTAGSGAQGNDAAGTLTLGANTTAGANSAAMDVAFLAWYNTPISANELQAICLAPLDDRQMIRPPAIWCVPGESGTSTQRDYSNYANYGTVTGATWAPTPAMFNRRRAPRNGRKWADAPAAIIPAFFDMALPVRRPARPVAYY